MVKILALTLNSSVQYRIIEISPKSPENIVVRER